MNHPVLQTVPLGFQWPTIDPFLFCVHHLDHYPAGNDAFGPAASLAGRNMGMDFEGLDGWRMYHGQTVPGFPRHPHRGFETVTFVRRGLIDHADSMGAAARYGHGDVQWMTAGGGIEHAEMFPLLDTTGPNPAELFQIWLNLPADRKMAPAHFAMFWNEDIPRATFHDGAPTTVTVVAGALDGAVGLDPPPDSWASQADADVAIWHIVMEPGARWSLPAAAGPDTVRVLYVFDGGPVEVAGQSVAPSTAVVLESGVDVALASAAGTEMLMLQGRPIAEPVVQHGPFVMNTRAEIEQAFSDYRRTRFGNWSWPTDDPVHGSSPVRFARHSDGRTEHAPGQLV